MFDKRNKTELVTGASSGMGQEIAKRLMLGAAPLHLVCF